MAGEGQQESRGYRVYLIREALGTRRDPMPMPQFAEMIAKTSGVTYDKSTLSRIETGERKLSLEDIDAIAPLDPLNRGKAWLAWGDEEGGQGATPANGDPKPAPTRRFVETPVQYDPPRPAHAKPKPVTKKPGRSAVA